MAGSSVHVELDAAEAQAALRRLEGAGDDLDELLAEIGEALLISTRRRFEQEVTPSGRRWPRLSQRYRQRKRRARDRILVLYGDLVGTLRYRVGGGAVRLGTDRVYGATHQFGDPSRGIPARPYLGLSSQDRQDILQIVADNVRRSVADG